jgi:hypothetical protein
MISCLTLTDDRQELDAQHMVCSYLVRACRQAMYELALEDHSREEIRHRAIQVLKVVHQDWLEAQKAIARERRASFTPADSRSTPNDPGVEDGKFSSEVK